MLRRIFLVAVTVMLFAVNVFPAGSSTIVKPYAVALTPAYSLTPLLSVADQVPEATNPNVNYQMVGIPDGLGLDVETLYMNHELTKSTLSGPEIGQTRYKGAYVSKYRLDAAGNPVLGERAYDRVYNENLYMGFAATETGGVSAFGRFCSGSLADRDDGLDRPIYFTGEEAGGADSFDGTGGLAVAIFDNELHTLPKMGRYAKENSLVQPRTDNKMVIINLEDGPATPDSQLFMYVGTKDRSPGSTVLRRNGLDNGKLYVFVGNDPTLNSEKQVQSGKAVGHWTEIANADTKTEAQLEAAADALGAYTFIRTEDGAFNKSNPNYFHFVTTGSATDPEENQLGRLYTLKLNEKDPLKDAKLQVIYNADTIAADGGDIAVSPDNLDVSKNFLMINEDGTTPSRTFMASKSRDGSIWRFPLTGTTVDVAGAQRVAELDPPGRDSVAVGPGIWETSGIIDVSDSFGPDTWIFDVQAHSPTAAPAANTVEDGQLLIMRPAP